MIRSRLAAVLRSLADRLAPLPAERVFIGGQDGEGDDALYPSAIVAASALPTWYRPATLFVDSVVVGAGGGGGGGGISFGNDGFGGGPVGAPA
ncbi:hypothetical protein [Nocardia sp. NPDC057227]|uniref:hypothetical protein n=1 Tax=Nocardia sp. NPDC057227 TaxID=3346056 RepID=UPI0036332AC5